jgi:acyl-CoA synthetase (AMP-forming)/AMP-acid ligase II
MIYTSGTTGASKGVVLTHSGLMAKSAAAIEVMGIAAEDRALMTLPACHVFSLTRQLFPHLMQGSEVHIVAATAPPDLLNHVIDTQGVTTFSGVPYHFRGMLMRGAGSQYPMRSLRLATSSSMKMPGELREALARAMPQTSFLAQYGITETSGLITSLPAALFTAKPDSVGRAVPGVELQIAERSDSPAACGEVLIRGAGVMSGYYRNPAATAAALTSDGWFVTGDMGRVDADGDLTLVGRKAFVIKRAGEFILPEEVEAVLNQHPGVADACVFGAADKLLGESVKACVVLRDSAVRPVEISRYCRENLASFKVPDEITVTAEFAKTSVGKIDKRAVIAAHWASHDTANGGWLP